MKPIRRLLIANRGEIAVRIIRACREMGISPVAVYSEADRRAPHVALADAAVEIGAPPASESYLRIDRILEAARRTGADAVHPGYGFLSERAAFAEACIEAGLTFVGPPPKAMRALGDKIAARQRMEAAGVPVVPGYSGDDQSDAVLTAEAERMGFPLLIKASAGGGGRGMRVVREAGELAGALGEARREAEAGFGDPRVLLERYVENPRHVEVQIFGSSPLTPSRGRAVPSVIHLFERECSIQRRHQKIIEESPSPILTPDLRARMTEAAVRAGQAAGYVNAGTVEMLLEERADGDHQFYFLEVNARLQVEHPVTELLTGIDLVKLQLRIARGEPLPPQESIIASGHTMEVRVYAEDPAAGFLPSVGPLLQWIEPRAPWVRVDSGFERGGEVSPYYDPMLAKVAVRGENRAEAIARMEQALSQIAVLGVRTNIPYLLAILRHPEFRAGRTHTGFLAQHLPEWREESALPDEVLLAAASEAVSRPSRARVALGPSEGDAYSPWRVTTGWRNG